MSEKVDAPFHGVSDDPQTPKKPASIISITSSPTEDTSPQQVGHRMMAVSSYERFVINQLRFQIKLEVGSLQDHLDSVVKSAHEMAREKARTDRWNGLLREELRRCGVDEVDLPVEQQ